MDTDGLEFDLDEIIEVPMGDGTVEYKRFGDCTLVEYGRHIELEKSRLASSQLGLALFELAIVATGPYAVSRNPMYVFATVVYMGIAFVVNTVWPIVFLPFGIALLYYGVIAREESYMEKVFGGEYLKYKARVRRWV